MAARWFGCLLVVAATALVTACGSSGSGAHALDHRGSNRTTKSRPHTESAPQVGIPSPGPTGIPADPAAVAVIKGWSDDLRRGDIAGAAAYFALPSVMINGPDANGNAIVIRIHTRAEAAAANLTLPCGAKFISADRRGRYVNALFRLTNRAGPGEGCGSGAGLTARTNFVISASRIVEWVRAPDDPGDNGTSPPPSPSPPPAGNGSAPTV